jgi:hypothetical protein
MNLHASFGANRTYRFEVIIFFCKIHFFFGGHLRFWKNDISDDPAAGAEAYWIYLPNLVGIRRTVLKSFNFFQYARLRRRPSWILTNAIVSIRLSGLWHDESPCRIWRKSILTKIHFFVGDHLGFWNIPLWSIPLPEKMMQDEAPVRILWKSDPKVRKLLKTL